MPHALIDQESGQRGLATDHCILLESGRERNRLDVSVECLARDSRRAPGEANLVL
jgi:hypothetical protein